jgi:hypothetical protein
MWSHLNTVKNLDQLVVTYEASQSSDRWMNENNKGDFFTAYPFNRIFLCLNFFVLSLMTK